VWIGFVVNGGVVAYLAARVLGDEPLGRAIGFVAGMLLVAVFGLGCAYGKAQGGAE